METEEVKTLSKRKQRLSLEGSANRKKLRDKESKKCPAKTTVLLPNSIEWPTFGQAWKLELLTLLKTLLGAMKIPNRKVPLNAIRNVEPEKRPEFRREWMVQEAVKVGFQISNYFTLRSNVALGVNCVSKSLERDKLVAVIIEENVNPDIITKLLIPIAAGKGVPLVSIDGLNSVFKSTCGMRCIAFGLKIPCADISNHFYPILEHITTGESSPTDHVAGVIANVALPNMTPSSSDLTPKRKGNDQYGGKYKKKKVRKL